MWHNFPETKPPAYKPVQVVFWFTDARKPCYCYTMGRYQPDEGDIPESWFLDEGHGLIRNSIVMAWQEIEPYNEPPNLSARRLDEWGILR